MSAAKDRLLRRCAGHHEPGGLAIRPPFVRLGAAGTALILRVAVSCFRLRVRRNRAELAAFHIGDGHAGDDIPGFQADFMRQPLAGLQNNRECPSLRNFIPDFQDSAARFRRHLEIRLPRLIPAGPVVVFAVADNVIRGRRDVRHLLRQSDGGVIPVKKLAA